MFHPRFYPFYPRKMFWKGMGVLGAGAIVLWIVLLFELYRPFSVHFQRPQERLRKEENLPLSFALEGQSFSFPLSLPHIETEVSIFLTPQRPDRKKEMKEVNIKLERSGKWKRISLPCRLFLQFVEEGTLGFSDGQSPFWLELREEKDGKIQAVVGVDTSAEKVEASRFLIVPRTDGTQEEKHFSEKSPFHLLADSKWLGHNILLEKETGEQTFRLMIEESQILDLGKEEWIVWEQKGWRKGNLDGNSPIIAHIESIEGGVLFLEGWDHETYIRFSLTHTPSPALKVKGEEIFKSIRIRSDQQISCMMEKQCLILRCGDWVLKTRGRWKVFRKKEEKEACKMGKFEGELFVFEGISSRQGQKFLSGVLFNTDKTQSFGINLPAHHRINRKMIEKRRRDR